MVNVGYNMFKSNNLNRIVSLLNESEKQTVFSKEQEPLTREDKHKFAESIASFSQMANSVSGQRNLEEIVERISHMVETASRLVTESDDDMLDKVAESRRLKMVEAALNDLKKSANEVIIHERRCAAAIDDIGEGLKKYYNMG
jgi:phage shock protein A